ncbi:extracellular solute-binding protein [Nonomuraea insulae]|uniref:Extracellular solute-binding protein n=1 Tax=Nonomuraea insulae TaxID=1616787 RepID=A0ABW1CF78_9ACTN
MTAFKKKKPGVQIKTQFSGWDGYREKLATQTAESPPPDAGDPGGTLARGR